MLQQLAESTSIPRVDEPCESDENQKIEASITQQRKVHRQIRYKLDRLKLRCQWLQGQQRQKREDLLQIQQRLREAQTIDRAASLSVKNETSKQKDNIKAVCDFMKRYQSENRVDKLEKKCAQVKDANTQLEKRIEHKRQRVPEIQAKLLSVVTLQEESDGLVKNLTTCNQNIRHQYEMIRQAYQRQQQSICLQRWWKAKLQQLRYQRKFQSKSILHHIEHNIFIRYSYDPKMVASPNPTATI